MLTWEELRKLSDAELGNKDSATVNLACSVGLPGTDDAALDPLFARLDEWTERARGTQAFAHSNGKSLEYCRVQRLVEVLGDAVRAAGSKPPGTFPVDDNDQDVLLLDLLSGRSWSRSAFLILYVAIGRRLGYPLKLLAAKGGNFFYLFGRWDDGKGEPFNIDLCAEGLCSHPDKHYRTGRHEVSAIIEKDCRLLKNLTPQEELALFLDGRGFKWEALGDYRKALDAFAWASAVAHWNASLRTGLTLAIQRWRAKIAPRVPPHFPNLRICWPPRRYPPTLMFEQEQAIIYTEIVEMLLRDQRHEKQYWEPMRKGWPMTARPSKIFVTCTPTRFGVKMTLAKNGLPTLTGSNAEILQPGIPDAGHWKSALHSPVAQTTVEKTQAVSSSPEAENDGPLTIERLLRMSEEDLARVDIAEMELLCAQGLPGTADLDIPACLRTIDEWAELIRDVTRRNLSQFERQPEVYDNSWATFRVVTMVLVLQRNLGMKYNEDRRNNLEGDDFFNRPKDNFIHGIISGNGGTCGSIPVMCVAVGRKLGYPLKLVRISQHQFFRWDEPGGERVNFEVTTGPGLNTFPDDYYRSWPRQLTHEEVEAHCFLESQTPRAELSSFLGKRGRCWLGNGNDCKALKCFGWSSHLNPKNVGPVCALTESLRKWKEKLKSRLVEGLPTIRLQLPQRYWFNLTWEIERDIVQTAVKEDLLRDDRYLKLVYWVKSKGKLPTGAPKEIKVEYPDRLMVDI